MKEQKRLDPETRKLTRREFLKAAAEAALALLGAELARYARVPTVAAAESESEKTEPKIDIPPGTYLTSQSDWTLRWLKRIPESVLEKYNGPKSCWSLPESGGVFLVPSSYFGGIDGVDELAKEKLSTRVTFRADVDRNEVTDEGWGEVELKLIQSLLPLAAVRNAEFFGKSRYQGLVRVSRPNKNERDLLWQRRPNGEQAAGLVAEGDRPGMLQISILMSLSEFAEQMKGTPMDQVVSGYLKAIKDLLVHEIAHVWLLGTKLGSLDNHSIVRAAGASIGLIDLIGKTPDEVKKAGNYTDLERPEMLLWKAFKVRGVEFYAVLQEQLRVKYGQEKLEFTDKEVAEEAEAIFKKTGFGFSFADLLEAGKKLPDTSKVVVRSMEGFVYPVEKVIGDKYNPDGLVSWWTEVPSLSPVSLLEKGWSRSQQIFPNKNGYYTSLKYLGNGKLTDGPPNGNSLAVATWMKGGSLTGGEVLFPPGVAGVETIRAVKKK